MSKRKNQPPSPSILSRSRNTTIFWLCSALLLPAFFKFYGWGADRDTVEAKLLGLYLKFWPAYVPKTPLIVTVQIDDEDYKQCFGQQSPLAPEGVLKLVKGVAAARPRVIGIDILTDAPRYAHLVESFEKHLIKAGTTPDMIWAADGQPVVWSPGFLGSLVHVPDRLFVKPAPGMGGPDSPSRRGLKVDWAVPVFPTEDNLSIRRLPRRFERGNGRGASSPPTFLPTWARRVAAAFCGTPQMGPPGTAPRNESCRVADDTDEVLIPFSSSNLRVFGVRELFSCANGAPDVNKTGDAWEEFKSSATDQIVLVGGTFSRTKDSYKTAVGKISGLTLNAYAVQAEVAANGISEDRWHLMFLLYSMAFLVATSPARRSVQHFLAGRPHWLGRLVEKPRLQRTSLSLRMSIVYLLLLLVSSIVLIKEIYVSLLAPLVSIGWEVFDKIQEAKKEHGSKHHH